jgi:CRISPR/Cas system CMR subunit Cmr6 (Cas7 group RAMP superfamily)
MADDVRVALGDLAARCANRSLRFDKFVAVPANSSERGDCLNPVLATPAALDVARLRWRPQDFPGAISFVGRTQARLIVNHAVGVIENAGLALDRATGLPYIPGSALKGLARAGAGLAGVGEVEIADTLGRSADTEAAAGGRVAFLPAFPLKDAKLELDVITCHHPAYYRGDREIATDDEEPQPHLFPSVAAQSDFLFVILPGSRGQPAHAARAAEWLKRALEECGAGAKTAAGYGWFDVSDDRQKEWNDECARDRALVEARERKRQEDAAKAEADRRRLELARVTANMTPAERASHEVAGWTDAQWESKIERFATFAPELQAAALTALRGEKASLWRRWRGLAEKGNKKERARWSKPVNDVFVAAKARKEKMP